MIKNIFSLFIAVILSLCVKGQYKKASFFGKTGRIYELGTTIRFQGSERGLSSGLYISLGREKEGRRGHHWFNAELSSGYRYKYNTVSDPVTSPAIIPVLVEGKVSSKFSMAYNYGIFFKKNVVAAKAVLPFLYFKVGIEGLLNLQNLDTYSTTPSEVIPYKKPEIYRGDYIFAPGAGILYRITERSAIRLSASYNLNSGSSIAYKNRDNVYSITNNHPALELGIRINMKEKMQ